MNYKLLITDMDGTLLNSASLVSETNRKYIDKLREKGLLFTIASGRAIPGVIDFVRDLKINIPFISYNGAMIYDPVSEKILYEKGLEREDAAFILKKCREVDVSMCIWSDNILYTNRDPQIIESYARMYNSHALLTDDDEALLEKGITKIIIFDESGHSDDWKKQAESWPIDVRAMPSNPKLLELVHTDNSKGNAVKRLQELLGLKVDEIICMGDEQNDLAMLEYAGLGVAMANSHKKVLDVADYVTLSNDEDGVSDVIKKFML